MPSTEVAIAAIAITAIVAIAFVGPMVIAPNNITQDTNVEVVFQSDQEENLVSSPNPSPNLEIPEQPADIILPDANDQPIQPELIDDSGKVGITSASILSYPGHNTTLTLRFSNTMTVPDRISIIVVQKAEDFFPDIAEGYTTLIPADSSDFEMRFLIDNNGRTYGHHETVSVIVTLESGVTIPIAISAEIVQ